MQDDLLIRRAQRGDNDAFEQLLLEHQKNVYNLCYRMAGNADDALDLSQETFLRAWRCLDQYQFASSFSTWLYRLCSNLCIDFLRRRKRQRGQQQQSRTYGAQQRRRSFDSDKDFGFHA